MPQASVYGNKPDTGPGMLAAQAANDTLNEDHSTWNVTHTWDKSTTVYISAIATQNELVAAVAKLFPGYNVN